MPLPFFKLRISHEHGVAFFRGDGDLVWTLDTAFDGFSPDAWTEVCMCL